MADDERERLVQALTDKLWGRSRPMFHRRSTVEYAVDEVLTALVPEGVGHSQTDRAPSDVLHADTSLSDPIIAGGNVTQWPEGNT